MVGVDTHRDEQAFAVLEVRSGGVVLEATAEASREGYAALLRLAEEHAPGRRAFAVEGTGSFGAGLARFVAARGDSGVLRRGSDEVLVGFPVEAGRRLDGLFEETVFGL